MNIVIKPVKCGDCCILCGKSEQLLIDCGSDNSDRGLCSSKFAFSAIQKEINNNEITNLMISHFHKDHFNGVLEIPSTYRFKTTYLPYSIIDGKIIYSKGIGRLLSVAPSRSWGLRLSRNIIELFRKLEKVSTTIQFIKQGDRIPFDNEEIRVLWPEVVTTGFKYGNLPVKITSESMQTGYKSFTRFRQEEPIDSLIDIENELEKQFYEIVGTDNKDLMDAKGNFIECFETYIRYLHENSNENTDANFTLVNEAYSVLNRQREIFRTKLDDKKLNIIKDFSRQQYHSLVTGMNAISIVCDCKERFIFLGDAPGSVIDYISSTLKNRYGFVKIQHHGTERYFTLKTPNGDYNLISNGGYERRKVSDKFIRCDKVICTNAHNDPQRFCTFYDYKGKCASVCIHVGLSYMISV